MQRGPNEQSEFGHIEENFNDRAANHQILYFFDLLVVPLHVGQAHQSAPVVLVGYFHGPCRQIGPAGFFQAESEIGIVSQLPRLIYFAFP